MTNNIDPFGDKFIVVTERDGPVESESHGPIALETYIESNADLPSAIQIAGRFHNLGEATIYKLVPVGDIQYCQELVDKELNVIRRRKF